MDARRRARVPGDAPQPPQREARGGPEARRLRLRVQARGVAAEAAREPRVERGRRRAREPSTARGRRRRHELRPEAPGLRAPAPFLFSAADHLRDRAVRVGADDHQRDRPAARVGFELFGHEFARARVLLPPAAHRQEPAVHGLGAVQAAPDFSGRVAGQRAHQPVERAARRAAGLHGVQVRPRRPPDFDGRARRVDLRRHRAPAAPLRLALLFSGGAFLFPELSARLRAALRVGRRLSGPPPALLHHAFLGRRPGDDDRLHLHHGRHEAAPGAPAAPRAAAVPHVLALPAAHEALRGAVQVFDVGGRGRRHALRRPVRGPRRELLQAEGAHGARGAPRRALLGPRGRRAVAGPPLQGPAVDGHRARAALAGCRRPELELVGARRVHLRVESAARVPQDPQRTTLWPRRCRRSPWMASTASSTCA